jgi:hypothetical protein
MGMHWLNHFSMGMPSLFVPGRVLVFLSWFLSLVNVGLGEENQGKINKAMMNDIVPPPPAAAVAAVQPPAVTTAVPHQTTKSTQSSRVRVAVRIRPLLAREYGENEVTIANSNNSSITVGNAHSFTFDHVYPQQSLQDEIYQGAVSPLVEEVVAGYNVTIMAYGQTGSGKTFTMGTCGHEEEEEEDTTHTTPTTNEEDDVGITPRSIQELFAKLNATGSAFEVSCSVLELYKDELRDLQRGGEEYCARGQSLRIQEVNG